MCIILDANCLSDFKNESNEDMTPVRKWVYGRGGRIAYSPIAKLLSEWKRGGGLELFRDLSRANKLKMVPEEEVEKKQIDLKGELESDDPHIVALALVAGVKVLVVQRTKMEPRKGKKRPKRSADTDLQKDFKRIVKGNVYQTKEHAHLLARASCP